MDGQLSFGGFGESVPPRRPVLDPIFFGILPDDPARAKTIACGEALKRELGLLGNLTSANRLHATSQWVSWPRDMVDEFRAIAERIAADVDMPAFDVTFDRVMTFRGTDGKHPLVLCGGAEQLVLLHQTLGATMKRLGLGKFVKPSFTPHVTMLYDKIEVPEKPVEPITWTVREFVLVHSFTGQGRHDVLARWLLRQ